MRWIAIVLLSAAALCTHVAGATTVTYDVINVSGNMWRYDYSVTNNTLASPIDEVTIFFALGEYSNLAVASAPGNWSSLVVQPDPSLPADGYYDSLALGTGLAAGQALSGFSATFTWLGPGSPGTQGFNIVDPNSFATLDSGNTVPAAPVPLPASLWLLLSAVAGSTRWWYRRPSCR